MKRILLATIWSNKPVGIWACIAIQLLNISNSTYGQKSSLASDTICEIRSSSDNSFSGTSSSLLIKSDSIFYTITNGWEHVTSIHKLILKQEWKKLTDLLNIDYLKKVKSGSSNQGFDGSDVFTCVKTSKNIYCFINGDQDTANYKYIRRFADSVQSIERYFWAIDKIDSISELSYSNDNRFSDTSINLRITADSIFFQSNSKSKSLVHYRKKISKDDWNILTNSFNFNLAENVYVNGHERNDYKAGVIFYIMTSDGFYLIRNPNKEIYEGISKLIDKN